MYTYGALGAGTDGGSLPPEDWSSKALPYWCHSRVPVGFWREMGKMEREKLRMWQPASGIFPQQHLCFLLVLISCLVYSFILQTAPCPGQRLKAQEPLVSAVSRKPHPGKGLANLLQRHPSHGIKYGTGHIVRTLGEMLCLDLVSPLLNALRIQFSHSTDDLERSYDCMAFNSVNIDFRWEKFQAIETGRHLLSWLKQAQLQV